MTEIFHTFQILKTEFISEKDNIDQQGISLQLTQSTCLMNYPINRNNVLQGNNLIYVNGAYVTFYNFFQNNKQFASVVLPHKTVGMVGNNTGRGNVAIVTQNQDQSQLYVSVYTFCQQLVPTYSIKKQLRFIDIIMLRTTHIILAAFNPKIHQYQILILNGKASSIINCSHPIKRLINLDHKIYIIFEDGGMYLMDAEKSIVGIEKGQMKIQFPDNIIDDYFQVDNETKVLLYDGGVLYCYWFQTQKQFVLDFRAEILGKACRMIKIGRNILVAHRNSLTISHFVIGQDTLQFVGHHTYHQKLKSGIISMQSSQDEMHAALAVQITERQQTKIQNFIFNLSSISKTHKFISPFIRVMAMGADWGNFSSMENVLSSNAYLLIGSKIFNLFYSTTLQRKKMFNLYEVPKFMTVHPLGYQILCGFDNIIKFYNKVEKDIQEIWSQQYLCTAAKYSKSGGLVLCCIQDSYTTLIVYDCYNFKRIRNVPMPLLKLYTTKIDWVQNNSAIVLSTNSQIIKVNVYNGQKLSEFRQKRENYSIKCIDYDAYSDKVIGGINSNNIILAAKTQHSGYNLSINKLVAFPEQVSYVKINYGLRTVFFGTKTGKLYWCNYPLKIKTTQNQQGTVTSTLAHELNVINLHNLPITSIDHTNNNKFMLVNVKNQGYFQFRIRKMRGKDSNNINMNIIFQELGNPILNTIDSSSNLTFAANKQKLKIALEKRKECFSDLEQFRRQWQVRLLLTSKQIQTTSKKDQLSFINETLTKIEDIKARKKRLQGNIEKIAIQIEQQKTNKQQNYIKQMLQLYEQQNKQNQMLQQKKKQYQEQRNRLTQQCNENISQIQQDLSQKRQKFYSNYNQMLSNLQNFTIRIQNQRKAEQQRKKQQKIQQMQSLKSKQLELTQQSNSLSIKITQNKKQYERYYNRRLFLEFKNKYFEDQNEKCIDEEERLQQLKERLEGQLKQLQVYTDKKQKKLKMYLQANQTLRKYKQIHQDLTQTALRQTQFIKNQKEKIDKNIVQVQKQLSSVAASNQTASQQITTLQQQIKIAKSKNYSLALRMKDISYYLNQIINAMDSIGYCQNQSQRSQKLKKIYQYYYVERSAQKMIEQETKNQLNYQKDLIQQRNQRIKLQQSKILGQLSDQKQYIIKNMDMFKNYNKRINQEINLNYLQIQAQNYNLIAECNLRKEQTINKKKVLNQLVDSVKQIQIYMDQIHNASNSNSNVKSFVQNKKKIARNSNQVPFVTYQRAKYKQSQLTRMKSNQEVLTCYSTNAYTHSRPGTCNKTSIKPNMKYQIKKMLDIKGIGDINSKQNCRRIQTATQKHINIQQIEQQQKTNIIKPFTATFKRRVARQGLKSALTTKKKSTSKLSSGALSRIKYSVAGI